MRGQRDGQYDAGESTRRSSLRRLRATLGVIGGAAVLTLVVPAVAGAETVAPYGGGNTVVTDPGQAESGVGAASAATDPGGSLPFTGGDVAGVAPSVPRPWQRARSRHGCVATAKLSDLSQLPGYQLPGYRRVPHRIATRSGRA